MSLIFRTGCLNDIEICGRICHDAFQAIAHQHNFPEDFSSPAVATAVLSVLFNRSDLYSVVAELDGQVVGSNFLWEGNSIAGVGPISVAPTVQNAAIGKGLMTAVLERSRAQSFAGVRLCQAAYHNRSLALYTKLGFNTREPLSVLQGPPLELTLPDHTVRPAIAADLEACNQLCIQVHGHDRAQDVRNSLEQGTAIVVERRGRITGYTTDLGYFGHSVGENNVALQALIGAAPSFPGTGFLLPTRNSDLLRWCLDQGLRIVQPLTLMSIGFYQEPRGSFLPSIIY
jgi:predicted N-acetyltransferase YhbS